MFENPRRDMQASNKFYKICSENSRSQIVFLTDIFRKLTLSAPSLQIPHTQEQEISLQRATVAPLLGGTVKKFNGLFL